MPRGSPRKEAASYGFQLKWMKEAISLEIKSEECAKYHKHTPSSCGPQFLALTRHPHLLPTPQEEHLRVPVQPPGCRAFLRGRENRVCLFPLESVQAEQCQRLGWGTRGMRQGPQGECAEFWFSDHRMCCYWLHPLLFGKCSFWMGLCVSVWAGCAKCPGSEGKGWCPCQMAGPEARERLLSSPGPRQHKAWVVREAALSSWRFLPASPPRLTVAG